MRNVSVARNPFELARYPLSKRVTEHSRTPKVPHGGILSPRPPLMLNDYAHPTLLVYEQ